MHGLHIDMTDMADARKHGAQYIEYHYVYIYIHNVQQEDEELLKTSCRPGRSNSKDCHAIEIVNWVSLSNLLIYTI